MRPYKYVKVDPASLYIDKQLSLVRGRKIIAGSLSMVGLSLMTYVGGYYGLWQVKRAALSEKPNVVDTIAVAPTTAFAETTNLAQNDLREANSASASEGESFSSFRVSIPRLQINNARVTTDVMSTNKDIYMPILATSLAHYKGSAYPGLEGNVLIYGHSILPAFYNPSNYLSIFSKLDSLEGNDPIRLTWGDKVYTYRVEGMSVVSPDDTRVLRYTNGKTLTLLTCVPPGLTTERLLVFARLEE